MAVSLKLFDKMTAQEHINWFLTSYRYGLPEKKEDIPLEKKQEVLPEIREVLPEIRHVTSHKKKYEAIPGVYLCQHLCPCRTRVFFYRYWVAIRPDRVKNPHKKPKQKIFSVNKYGFYRAKELATIKRKEFEDAR